MAVGLAACGGSTSSSTTSTAAGSTGSTGNPTSNAPGTTSGTAPGSTTTSAPGTPACRTSSLSVSLGSPNGSAGAMHYGLTFQNTGTAACLLYGFPGVSFLDASGSQIGDPAQRQGSAPTPVVLASGGSAYSSISITDPGIPPCSGSAHASQVRVYPPGETHASQVPATSGMLVCSSPNTSAYRSSTVSAVSSTAT